MTERPWSTMPVTGAQHDAWMAEERQQVQYPSWVLTECQCGEYDRIHKHECRSLMLDIER